MIQKKDREALAELFETHDSADVVDNRLSNHFGLYKMTLLTENNEWAIVWMHERYYLRHQTCGSYIKTKSIAVNSGCRCRKGVAQRVVAVDPLILSKFLILTKGDK